MTKFCLIFILIITTGLFANDSSIQHNLFVNVDPGNQHLTAIDTITIPANQAQPEMYFLLHGDLTVKSKSPNVKISLEESEITGKDFGMDQEDFDVSSDIKQNKYRLKFENFKDSEMSIILKFEGKIHHPNHFHRAEPPPDHGTNLQCPRRKRRNYFYSWRLAADGTTPSCLQYRS